MRAKLWFSQTRALPLDEGKKIVGETPRDRIAFGDPGAAGAGRRQGGKSEVYALAVEEEKARDEDGFPIRASDGLEPRACFMHVPKSAGISITSALEAALPPGSLAPYRIDYSVFCGFDDFESLRPEARRQVIANPQAAGALRGYDAVAGHFCLATLQSVAPTSAVCTVLREPRARLLSLYTYWRTAGAGDDFWAPYRIGATAWRPLAEFLSDARLAPAIDNQVCRLLLAGDPRFPKSAFMAKGDAETVAAAAIERLDELGFVGVLELGQSAWDGVGQIFGVNIEQQRTHVTGDLGRAAGDVDHVERSYSRCSGAAAGTHRGGCRRLRPRAGACRPRKERAKSGHRRGVCSAVGTAGGSLRSFRLERGPPRRHCGTAERSTSGPV